MHRPQFPAFFWENIHFMKLMNTHAALFSTLSALALTPMGIAQTVDFVKDVKPLLEGACLQCHSTEHAKKEGGDYIMETKEAAFKGGDSYEDEVIISGNAKDSPAHWMLTLEMDDDDLMPPKKPLNKAQQAIIGKWIDDGAKWPDGVVLEDKPRVNFKNIKALLVKGGKGVPFTPAEIDRLRLWAEQGADWPEGQVISGGGGELGDNIALVKQIRKTILENSPEKSEGEMKAYTGAIAKTGEKYEMVPIQGGEFTMGSPDAEEGRFDDEGPQHKVKIEPFWMGKYEVQWTEYEPFMVTSVARNKDGSPEKITDDMAPVDIVSSPTTPYVEMSFGLGNESGFPAICMTQHGANKYCQWLSAQTGHFYRLPTEAEWEYACRAGTAGAFHCDEADLADYAVFDPDQTRNGYDKVGTKKPNPWGLYDMHGNVMEWVIDQYNEKLYSNRKDTIANGPIEWPRQLYPRVARGGSWYDPPEELRSARRIFSDESWKVQDPQLPKSIWYHTDAQWLGFRIVRPLTIPSAEEMEKFWNVGALDIVE